MTIDGLVQTTYPQYTHFCSTLHVPLPYMIVMSLERHDASNRWQLHCLFYTVFRRRIMNYQSPCYRPFGRIMHQWAWIPCHGYLQIVLAQHGSKLLWIYLINIFSFIDKRTLHDCPSQMNENLLTSNGSWCMGIKGEISGTVCVTFTWDMYIHMSCL